MKHYLPPLNSIVTAARLCLISGFLCLRLSPEKGYLIVSIMPKNHHHSHPQMLSH